MKTIKFYTLGCKVNQYDTQSIRERFISAGFKEIYNGQKADVYVINTCTVTHRADAESLNLIRRAQRQNPQAKIMVTGCLIQKDDLSLSKLKGVDFIISKRFFADGISNFCGHTRAFLKIQDGCDNFCSYCIVPRVRGGSRSRDLAQIIKEAKVLVKNAFKEIVLTGICLGSYGKDFTSQICLVDVIEELEKIDGLLRIRLSSIEAGDVSDKLIDKMAESKKLCRHLHIPIQSGDDKILKKMNRKYSRDDYLNLINEIKSQIPQIAITTDVLVGFPGETEENFKNTVELIKEILPLKVHIFPYSRRKGTTAAGFKQEIGERIIKQRAEHLKMVSKDCASRYKRHFLGRNMQVLVEEKLKKNNTFWVGHTGNYLTVAVKSNADLKNQLIALKLKKIGKDCIIGEL